MLKRVGYLWRLLATAMSFALFGIGGVIIPVLATPIIWLSSRDSRTRQIRARWLVHSLFQLFVKFMKYTGVLTWRINGFEKLNQPGVVILANHPTLLDVVFLVSFVPNADCVVKGKLMRNPAMRGFVRLTGYITNDHQGVDLINKARSSLADGSAMIIFPEGTRTRPNGEIKFQRGAANMLVRTEARALPVIINCTPLTLSKQHKWYHIPPTRFHLEFWVLDEIDLTSYKSMPAALSARQLTKDLQELFREELLGNEQGLARAGSKTAHHQHS